MRSLAANVLYVLVLAAVIVAVDFLFVRDYFWQRLGVNVGIVLIFTGFYIRFARRT